MHDYVWEPDASLIRSANVSRLMRKLGYAPDENDPRGTYRAAREFVAATQRDPEWFWPAALADMNVEFSTPYTRLLDTSRGPAWADWFIGGETNIAANCIDRHASGPRADKLALLAETEDGSLRRFSYAELHAQVSRLAHAMQSLGIGPGDRVACYLPMIAEVVIAMFATHKLGAVFLPIFSGYAPPSVRERLVDAGAKLVFTSDGSYRRGEPLALKSALDVAVAGVDSIRQVVVVKRVGGSFPCPMQHGRDFYWDELMAGAGSVPSSRPMPAMAPALMLYTSGTTGKPKGTVHTHAGCLAQMGKEVFYNLDLRDSDLFWWFTDIGWMMGPWELIGGMLHGGSIVIFEGAPNFPEPDRLWKTAEHHGVTTLGISPTAVRMLMRAGDEWIDRHALSSLRILGSTGEAWDEASYLWFFERVGRKRCPVINISGGTDIVGCFLAPLPVLPIKATSLQIGGLGMAVDVFNEQGRPVRGEVGYLVCTKPAPSMTRSLWGNDAAYLDTYWSKFEHVWNHGDWALIDADGDWFHYGRADDTLKIAGRRVGPGEIESALIGHTAVSEAVAVGVPDELKGTDVVCFVVLHTGYSPNETLRAELVQTVVDALGKVDRPKAVYFVDDLPKTRSAKILRRMIARRHLGHTDLGDVSSLANPEALDAIARAR